MKGLWFLTESNEQILKSVLNGSRHNSHKDVVALNSALVLWVAGLRMITQGFKKALFSINQETLGINFYSWKLLILR